MLVSQLLRHFQATHELLAFVVDEYGTVVGIVTLENVLEQIVGPVDDEFDSETADLVAVEPGKYLVQGSTPLAAIQKELDLDLLSDLAASEVDTLSGLLMTKLGHVPEVGDRVDLEGATAEVVEAKGSRSATRIRIQLNRDIEVPLTDSAPK